MSVNDTPETETLYFELFYDEKQADEDCGIKDFIALVGGYFDSFEPTGDGRFVGTVKLQPDQIPLLHKDLERETLYGVAGLAEWDSII